MHVQCTLAGVGRQRPPLAKMIGLNELTDRATDHSFTYGLSLYRSSTTLKPLRNIEEQRQYSINILFNLYNNYYYYGGAKKERKAVILNFVDSYI